MISGDTLLTNRWYFHLYLAAKERAAQENRIVFHQVLSSPSYAWQTLYLYLALYFYADLPEL